MNGLVATESGEMDVQRRRLESLSHIERVAVALVCFERFCGQFEISHQDLSRFSEHLWGVTSVNPSTWVRWANAFDDMPFLSGELKGVAILGDAVPAHLAHEFAVLLRAVFETTEATWYCGNTAGTVDALLLVHTILDKHGVPRPDPMRFALDSAARTDRWGPEPDAQTLRTWRQLGRIDTSLERTRRR